ncbi:MAG: pitrilysin family protein [Thermoguttaceae bacterium]|jgi:predicted Zn-dependent peptidase
MEFCKHTLTNGLEIVAECDGEAHSSAYGFFVKTGARDETDAISGVSHFLEHMMFKGTPTRSADDVNRQFDEMGAINNAGTNEEYTVYYAAVLPEFQSRAVAILADILRPSLREADFNLEKQVILEEIKMYEDQPPFGADDKCRAAFFGSHPLGRSVLGTIESVSNLSPLAMREYFENRYSPGNIVLAGAGRIDFAALVDCVSQSCGHWRPVATGREASIAVPNLKFETICKEIATQQYVIEMAPGPSAEDDDRYAAKLLATILGDDTGSRLYWELVDPGLADQVSLSHCDYSDTGLMITYMSCEPHCAADNLESILKVYRLAETEGLAEAELAQAKSKIRSRIVLSSERPRIRLFAVGGQWLYRREYKTVGDELDAIAAVTLDEVHAVLKKYPLSRCATLTIGPLDKLPPPG